MPLRRLGEQVETERIVGVFEECPFAAVATLGDVMGNAGQNHAGKTSHLGMASAAVTKSQFRGLRTCHRNSHLGNLDKSCPGLPIGIPHSPTNL
jgi:hypothetical protein